VRLDDETRQVIRQTVRELFGAAARVRLFGSRLDDTRRGGDIDLLVELSGPDAAYREKALKCVAQLQMKLGDQPIDLLVSMPGVMPSAVHAEALRTGVLL
jgi:predicted nucleotidyltransferase